MEKKKYETPLQKIVFIGAQDVITNSDAFQGEKEMFPEDEGSPL